MKFNFKTISVLFFLAVFLLLISFGIYISITRQNLAPNDSSASILTTASPASTSNAEGTCPYIDVNSDLILDIIDFSSFARNYQSTCTQPVETEDDLCGTIDTNNDSHVNIADFSSFALRYQDICFL